MQKSVTELKEKATKAKTGSHKRHGVLDPAEVVDISALGQEDDNVIDLDAERNARRGDEDTDTDTEDSGDEDTTEDTAADEPRVETDRRLAGYQNVENILLARERRLTRAQQEAERTRREAEAKMTPEERQAAEQEREREAAQEAQRAQRARERKTGQFRRIRQTLRHAPKNGRGRMRRLDDVDDERERQARVDQQRLLAARGRLQNEQVNRVRNRNRPAA